MLFRNDKRDPHGPPTGGEQRVPLLPLRDIIVFPHMVVPLFVGRQKSIRALEEAVNKQKPILLAAQKDAKTNEPAEEDIYRTYDLGANSFVTKPVSFDGLVNVMRDIGRYWIEIVELPPDRLV